MTPSEAPRSPAAYEFGPFHIDVCRRKLWRDGRTVDLPSKAFDILLVLVSNRDRIVEKEELLAQVWPRTFVTEDSLIQSVSLLRRALGEDSRHPQFIATAPRHGYRFIGAVTEVAEAPPPLATEALSPRETTPAPDGNPGDSASANLVHDDAGGSPEPQEPSLVHSAPAVRTRWPFLIGTAVLALLVVAVTWRWRTADPPSRAPLRFALDAPAGTTLSTSGALSPDGRSLAFVAFDRDSRTSHLWVRTLSSDYVRKLDGTEGASRPFWSPDGEGLGFFADRRLKVTSLSGGKPRTLAWVGPNPAGATWNSRGTILFAKRWSPLYAVQAEGGPVAPVSTLNGSSVTDRLQRWPHFLPDGRRFLYTVRSDLDGGVFVGSLDSRERVQLAGENASAAIYAPPGYLLYFRGRTLLAQRFDPSMLRLSGEVVTIATDVDPPNVENAQAISAAAGDLLVFGTGEERRRLAWFGRDGRELGQLQSPTVLTNLSISADRRFLLGDSEEEDYQGVWRLDLDRGTSERVSTSGSVPAGSPDETQVIFTAMHEGALTLVSRNTVDGTDRPLLASKGVRAANDWSRDGRYVVYERFDSAGSTDLWAYSTATREETPLTRTPFKEIQAEVSPDGRWMTYASDESGSWEVYLQSFPKPGARHIVSAGGGAQPHWRADNREIFYMSPDRRLMAVSVALDGATTDIAKPVPLFVAPTEGDLESFRSHYVVSSDGQQFLVDVAADRSRMRSALTVMVNWTGLIGR